jgi:hypothetical protein
MRTPEEFKQKVKERKVDFWISHPCSMCNYPVGYVFKGKKVFYDNGCYCTNSPSKLTERKWEDVADKYNQQNHPEVIKRMDEFWGFESKK